jgi:hypothetical protein
MKLQIASRSKLTKQESMHKEKINKYQEYQSTMNMAASIKNQ